VYLNYQALVLIEQFTAQLKYLKGAPCYNYRARLIKHFYTQSSKPTQRCVQWFETIKLRPKTVTTTAVTKTPQQHTDDLLLVANDRDRDAFSRLFDHYMPLLRAFTLSAHPGSAILADEVAQEVMIKVWRKAHTYKPEFASASTWIFTLARNARIDYLRKNSRHQSDIDPEYLWSDIPSEDGDPFQAALQKRSADVVQAGMSQLPDDQRLALKKVYLEGKTHKEVAEELQLPLGTVKSRVRLALKKLAVSIKR
jgi:RNA polymerase sigma factor, sigma-70 family